jgi:hypothetical protein
MKASATILVLLLIATSVMGQEEPATTTQQPDYSRDTLLRLLAENPDRPEVEPPVRFRVGAVEFRALGSEWQFVYLPLMMPLSGSRITTTQEWPDPFSLTRTVIATSPRAWRTQRSLNSEMRRIEQTERARIRID